MGLSVRDKSARAYPLSSPRMQRSLGGKLSLSLLLNNANPPPLPVEAPLRYFAIFSAKFNGRYSNTQITFQMSTALFDNTAKDIVRGEIVPTG